MDIMGGILTKGLGGTACTHLILGPMRLHCGDVPHPTPSGGTSVRRGSDVAKYISQRHKEIRDDDDVPQLKAKKQITVTLSLKDRTHEKTFVVEADRAARIVKLAEWVHKTHNKMRIAIKNFMKTDK